MSLFISELFVSILGESTHAGKPCVLVRLAGCNLRCSYCDTPFARHGGAERTVDEVVQEVLDSGLRLVLVTGGEPLLQAEAFCLIDRLVDQGKQVILETNGSLDITPVNPQAIIVLDVKCPDSGESEKMQWQNLDKLRTQDEVKFVVSSRADFDWSKQIITRHKLNEKVTVLLSPAYGRVEPRDMARWILEERVQARLHLQLHKCIWGADVRGV